MEHLPAIVQPVAAFVLYFASGVILTGLFLAIYLRLTPYAEMALIRAGNRAAATSLAGGVEESQPVKSIWLEPASMLAAMTSLAFLVPA